MSPLAVREEGGSRTGISQAIRTWLRDVGPRLARAHRVNLRRCLTADVECMAGLVRARALRKDWRDRGVHVGSTACTPQKRRPKENARINSCERVASS
jgi:hypothetical protein